MNHAEGYSDWVDLCGLLGPRSEIDAIVRRTAGGTYESLEELSSQLKTLYDRYNELEWKWCYHLMLDRLSVSRRDIGPEHLIEIISDWEKNAVRLNNMIMGDAQKEFSRTAKIGYGIDGGTQEQEDDFLQVRGKYEENSFVLHLVQESETVKQRAGELISILRWCSR